MIENYNIQGGKGGESTPHTPVETPNNLLSVAYAKVLIAVAEGELAGKPSEQDIYLDGTPLANSDGSLNFGGVKWEWRPGTQDQEHIAGLPEVSTEYGIGIELKANTPWTRLITKTQLDAVRVTLAWPALLEQKQNGDTVGVSIDYAIDIQTDGGAFVEYQKYNVNGKTNTTYERTHRVDLPKARTGWTVRVRKLTPDTTASNIQNKMQIKSYTEVVDAKQRYPNTALLYVEFDSRMFSGGSVPRVSVRTKGRIIQVPANYNPETRTYNGVWAGDFKWAWTDNPAWVFYDLITQNRFGIGHKVDVNMIDKWAMYEVAQYCDVMVDDGTGSGEKEPRHTCNIYLQSKASAWQVLRDIASIFNGMTYWDGTKFVASVDKRESIENIPMFSRSNCIGGKFNYQAADDKSIYTSALVSYDDPNDHYNTQVEAAFETSQILRWGGDRQVEISAIGCTSRGEAQRKAHYTLITNMYNRTVTFQTGLQGLNGEVLPGKLIHVLDPLLGGRPFTGRTVAGTSTVITLDRDVQAKAGDVLYITNTDGSTQGRTVKSASGRVITVTVAYTKTPAPTSVWYLEASDLKSQLFRVTKITSPSESVFEISAVEYNESKYDAVDNGARLEPRPISVVPPSRMPPPTNVKVSSFNYVEQTMSVQSMVISWDQMPNATQYEVQWKLNNGDWVNAGVTGAPEITIKGIYTGDYIARVRSINAVGIKSIWASSVLTSLAGKTGTPPSLASLTTAGMLFGIRLDWTFPPLAEDTLRTEIMYSETSSFANAIKLGDFSYPTDSHEMHGLKAGQAFWFWGRLVDRSGNVGPWKPLSTEQGVRGSSLTNDNGEYNDYFAEMISKTALDKELYSRVELIDGPATLPGSVNERIKIVNNRVDLTNEKLDDAVKDLTDKINNVYDALLYDPKKTYVKGDVVREGQKLYQAKGNVPVNSTPPNEKYWLDVGTVIEESGGLAARVELNEQNIEKIDGIVTAVSSQIESLNAQWRDDDGEGDLLGAMNTYDNKAAITEERTVRASENEAMAQRIVTITSQVGDNKAAINTLEKTTATNDQALSERIDSVSASTKTETDRLDAAIKSEQTARTNADEAMGKRVDTVGAKIETETSKLDAAITTEQTARVKADSALGERITSTQATLTKETSRLDAAVTAEETARVNADGALGRRVDTVGAQISDETTARTAAIKSEQEARVSADTAMGKRVDQVQATVDTNKGLAAADIKTEQEARASADTAMGKRVDLVAANLETETGNRQAAIASEAKARVDGDSAVSTKVDQVQANLNTETSQRKAAITSEQEARVSATEALGKRIDTVEAGGVDMSEIKALVQTESDARVAGDQALGKRVDTVQSTADKNTASVAQVSKATSDLSGKVSTAWSVRMEVNSKGQYVSAGIGLGIENGKNGLLQSQFLVRADTFAVVAGEAGTTSAPFVVSGGQVFINDALINKAFIGTAIIGQTLQSAAYTNWGGPVMTMDFNSGNVICRHPTRVNTYSVMNQDGIQVIVDGVLRVRMGIW